MAFFAWRRSTAAIRAWLIAAAAVALALGGPHPARAQSYPDKPIRLILPYTAGSPNDVLARLIAPALSARLGQPIIVENRPGGGTTTGVSAVLGAEPDGHTLLFTNSPTHQIVPVASPTPLYDALKDFVPIATVAAASNVIVIGNDVPAKTVAEFVAYAKANPGKLNFGFGQGTLPQLVGEMFKSAAAIDIINVPYKGGAQAVPDVLGGRIQMNIGNASTLLPLHRAGQLRIIGYTGTARSTEMPDIPTMAESGYPSVVSTTYYGIFGRADLPGAIVSRLNAEVGGMLKAPELRDSLAKIGFEPTALSPGELKKLLAEETKKWTAIVKATGFQL
jgi:tripartite-type tricarboxylate transporter receptor subunit TctC